MSRLKEKYKSEIKKSLKEQFEYSNDHLIPELQKIVVTMGIGEASRDKNAIEDCVNEMRALSGQKPIITKAKKAIANYKTRVGHPLGIKVTLRKTRMYDFLDRFCNIVSPRIRDFRGFSTKCDGQGNYSLGITDQQIFPEINLDNVKRVQGLNITFVTSAKSDEECFSLLKLMGIPFKEKK